MAKQPTTVKFGSLKAVSAATGVNYNTLTGWRQAGWLPGADRNWDLAEMFGALAGQFGTKRVSTPEAEEKRSAEARKLLADAGMKEFMLEKARGDYASKTDVRLELAEFFIMFKDGVARVAPSLRAILPREVVEEVVRKVDQALKLEVKALVNRASNMRSLQAADEGGGEEAAMDEEPPEEAG